MPGVVTEEGASTGRSDVPDKIGDDNLSCERTDPPGSGCSQQPDLYGALLESYELGDPIGKGAFATVYAAVNRETGQQVAAKVLYMDGEKDACELRQSALDEYHLNRRVHKKGDTPSRHAPDTICRLVESFESPHSFTMVFEMMKGGPLDALRLPLSESDTQIIMRRVLGGIAWLHKHRIAHCDIKMANVALREPGNLETATLIDLGLATDMSKSAWMTEACGTPQYFAPEMISCYTRGTVFGPQVDEWAAGILMYTLLCGHLPFDGATAGDLFAKIKHYDGKSLPASANWDTLSDTAKDILIKLLDPSRHSRIHAAAALRHKFLKVPGDSVASKLHSLLHMGWPRPTANNENSDSDSDGPSEVSEHSKPATPEKWMDAALQDLHPNVLALLFNGKKRGRRLPSGHMPLHHLVYAA